MNGLSAFAVLAPQLAVACGLVGLLAAGLGRGRAPSTELRGLAAAALLAAASLVPAAASYGALFGWDGPARLWQPLFFLGALAPVALLPAADELPLALVLGSALGMSLLAAGRDLFVLFLGLELMSLPAYLLVYASRRTRVSLEAALKYLFAGGAAAALYLLGMAATYAATGSFSLSAGAPAIGLALMASAALFKIGAFPLHFWLPDVYQAASPELAGFLSTSMKAAGVLLLMRLLAAGAGSPALAGALPIVAACTMTLGNVLALRQTSLQRLLAYSSIAHAGYLLLGVSAWAALGRTAAGAAAVYVYLLSYLAMNTGAFAALRLGGLSAVSDLRGLGRRAPRLAAALALMLVSLAGVPPTAGFLAKLLVFWDAVKAGLIGVVVVAALNSLVGLSYYFKLIRAMYFEDVWEGAEPPAHTPLPEPPPAAAAGDEPPALGRAGGLLLLACAVPTIAIGVCPWIADWVEYFLTR